MPALRPLNTAYDGYFGILTLGEVISLARTRSTDDRPIRVLAELKHADWSTEHGLPMAELRSSSGALLSHAACHLSQAQTCRN